MQSVPRTVIPKEYGLLLTCALVNQVLAGALKDNKRALIAGERTFGKGLIQTVVELSDGSAVAVTVSRYVSAGNHVPVPADFCKLQLQACMGVSAVSLPARLRTAACSAARA